MSETRTFTCKVHQESDHIWAEVQELPGCFVTAANVDELRDALVEAIGLYLDSCGGRHRSAAVDGCVTVRV